MCALESLFPSKDLDSVYSSRFNVLRFNVLMFILSLKKRLQSQEKGGFTWLNVYHSNIKLE